jgi:hypothetical protein
VRERDDDSGGYDGHNDDSGDNSGDNDSDVGVAAVAA